MNLKKALFNFIIFYSLNTTLNASEVSVNALWNAIENENVQDLDNIIRHNRRILSTVDEMGNSILHVAVMQNNPAIVRLILSRNNNLVRSRGMFGDTPLVLALRQYNDTPSSETEMRNNIRSIILALIDHGADPSIQTFNTLGTRIIPAHMLVPELSELLLARTANR